MSSERTPAMDWRKDDIHSLSWLITAALGSPKNKTFFIVLVLSLACWQKTHTNITCSPWGVDVQGRTLNVNVGPQLTWQRLIRGQLNFIREAFDALHITALAQDEHTDALLLQHGQHFLYSPLQFWVRQARGSEREEEWEPQGQWLKKNQFLNFFLNNCLSI